jgi:N-acyl-D-amino-acid deacylase
VAPGFVDVHAHDDFNLPVNPQAAGKILQGVTSEVVGNCGFSPAPILPGREAEQRAVFAGFDSGLSWNWHTFAEFLAALPPTGLNVVPLVGHVTVRSAVMGMEDRDPRGNELERMQALVAEAMEAGALGFSTGLIYPPCSFAKTGEIVELMKVAARYGGSYHTHMRDEGAGILDSIRESVEIARQAGAPLLISHLKVANQINWGRADEVLALLDAVRREGLTVHADQYPYTAASTILKILLPRWALEGGSAATVRRLRDPAARAKIRDAVLATMGAGSMRIATWDDAIVAESPSQHDCAGQTLAEIGRRTDRQPVEALFDLLIADAGRTLAIFNSMSEDDVRKIMRHPAVAVGSDGIYLGAPGKPETGRPHPRYFGTFPRVVGHYARDERVIALPEAVRKMTGLAADILRWQDRGRLKSGFAADVVVFDPARVLDRATFDNPHQSPAGIGTVLVNGTAVVRGGQLTGERPGKVLRHRAG